MSNAIKTSTAMDAAPGNIAPFSLRRWAAPRRAILTTISIGIMSWLLMLGLLWSLWPAVDLPADRVVYALQLAPAPALILLLMITSCMRLFDTENAENPLAGAESQRFQINQRVISNTVEQSLVFVPLLLALATRLPDAHFKLLPIALTLWCTGRLLFWIGYHIAPHWRAPGMDWTMLTSGLLAGWYVSLLL